MKKIFLILFTLIPLPGVTQSQEGFLYGLDETIPLSDGIGSYTAPWTGGLNAAQYSTLDLNFDGTEDLVLYDRMAQKVITFLRTENNYAYAAEYETVFPGAVYNWLLLRDFNGDGKKDLFTGHIFGISVYQNVSVGTEIKWELYYFYEGTSRSEVVLTQGLSGRINLQLQFDDLPSIADADGDGDIDIFAMNYGGAGVIEFHKNLSQEKYGKPDSLDFQLVNNWWGGVRECQCGQFTFNNEDCSSLPGRVEHAGGKSLLLMDGNGDGVKDMIITEGECENMFILLNTGSVESPVIQQALPFPFSDNNQFSLYPTGYFEDIDHDGVKDLMVSPNIYAKSDPTMNLAQSNWFFKNLGTDSDPDFALQTSSFLQSSMLDVGDNAVPAFADFDADGDEDLFISNNSFPPQVRLYENKGAAFQPAFELYSDDYLNLSVSTFGNMRIKIVDLDRDGKKDFVFTGTDFYTGITDVYFIRNKGESRFDFSGQTIERLYFQLSGPENASFVDVNGDGRVDILRGRSNGSVEWWEHLEQPLRFNMKSAQFLGLGANVYSNNMSFAEADLNADGRNDLIISDQSGKIRILSDYRRAKDLSEAMSDVVLNRLTSEYYSPNLGGRTWIATAKLYGGMMPEIFAGTSLGGVRILRNTANESSDLVINLYPNPVNLTTQALNVSVNKSATLKIYTVSGQLTRPEISIPAKQLETLSLYDFASGMYILQFTSENKKYIRRLVVY